MARQKSEKRMKAFKEKVEKIITNLGGKADNQFYKWTVPTKAGGLFVDVHERPSEIFSIFCRFDDTQAAKDLLGKDFVSGAGKWNFHMSDEKEILELFESYIKNIQ